MTGRARERTPVERIPVNVPVGIYASLVATMKRKKRWFNRQEFVLEAIKEKIEREERAEGTA